MTLITGALESAGIIDNHRSRIEVVDRFALEAAACDCYPAIRTRRDEFELRFASSPDAAHPAGENEGAELSF